MNKATDKTSTSAKNISYQKGYIAAALETSKFISDHGHEIPFSDPLEDEFPTYAVQTVFGEYISTPDGWMFFQPHDGGRPQMIATFGNAAISKQACTTLNSLLTHPSLRSH